MINSNGFHSFPMDSSRSIDRFSPAGFAERLRSIVSPPLQICLLAWGKSEVIVIVNRVNLPEINRSSAILSEK
jgi:hypothetical protein